jgi:hypothetical protein
MFEEIDQILGLNFAIISLVLDVVEVLRLKQAKIKMLKDGVVGKK